MNLTYVGTGQVKLIAGGGKLYTDVAARFCKSQLPFEDLTAESQTNYALVDKIVKYGHSAITEFDYFIFAVYAYSRVTETQLVRKRMASFAVSSNRDDRHGKRSFDIVVPRGLETLNVHYNLNGMEVQLTTRDILGIIESWYNQNMDKAPEEDLRYLKPQGTAFKGLIGMNAHALNDWFKIRCCMKAQLEIRDMAWKMLKICKEVAPPLFEDAGPSCKFLGYCPEEDMQHAVCKNNGKYLPRSRAMELLAGYKEPVAIEL